MKKNLMNIAKQLSDAEIQEVIRLKKSGDKKAVALAKKRDKLQADLARVEKELAAYTGGVAARTPAKLGAPAGKKRGRKPAVKAAPEKQAPEKKVGRRGGRRAVGRGDFSAAVREVFSRAGTPLKARQVVEGLPEVGIKVKNEAEMRKRISVVLASQKNHFDQVERGLYKLKDS